MRIIILGFALFIAGCATTNTLEKRKAARPAVYQNLTQEFKTLVDQQQIKDGMTEDGVYLAWGQPSEILTMENKDGPATKWLYKGIYLQGVSYYAFRPTLRSTFSGYYGRPESPVMERRLEHDYAPHDYVRAEVDFVNGIVKKWRLPPKPR